MIKRTDYADAAYKIPTHKCNEHFLDGPSNGFPMLSLLSYPSIRCFFLNFRTLTLTSPMKKMIGVLTYLDTNIVCLPTKREIWSEHSIVKNSFWAIASELSTNTMLPFESMEEDEVHVYQTFWRIILCTRESLSTLNLF